eukprot:TRINITY_DN15981_c0_g1_i1.p1 TRINITY_DN15981_c0_g1~~TRINITY_DN15981_c0_g1_i1.p1  ORF type:complete len:492 (-),score=141.57 TRINITY_DN15981_c0_g1_i1:398-1873(-)
MAMQGLAWAAPAAGALDLRAPPAAAAAAAVLRSPASAAAGVPLETAVERDGLGSTAAGVAAAASCAAVAAASVQRFGTRRRQARKPQLVRMRQAVKELKENGSTVPQQQKFGIMLLNIGTPASTSVEDVREYLTKFLGDERVIDLEPPLLKWIVLKLILATRPKSSAENYAKIWDAERGSPLLYHTEDLVEKLQSELGDTFEVRIGMQYSEPSVQTSLEAFAKSSIDDVLLVPMFPHYASGTTGSCVAGAYQIASKMFCTPYLSVLPPFFSHPSYVSSMTSTIIDAIGHQGKDIDHFIFSFHGLPEEQCYRTDDSASVCGKRPDCCEIIAKQNRNCYRAQCVETARRLAREIGLEQGKWSLGFQSRLTLRGRVKWITPYTDEVLMALGKQGLKKVAIVAPSFTADCVETLEELGCEGKEIFQEAGGEELIVVPCLNSSDFWTKNLAQILREHLSRRSLPTLYPLNGERVPCKGDGAALDFELEASLGDLST